MHCPGPVRASLHVSPPWYVDAFPRPLREQLHRDDQVRPPPHRLLSSRQLRTLARFFTCRSPTRLTFIVARLFPGKISSTWHFMAEPRQRWSLEVF